MRVRPPISPLGLKVLAARTGIAAVLLVNALQSFCRETVVTETGTLSEM